MAWSHGGKVGKCDHREYGFAEVDVVKAESKNPLANKLFDGLGDKFQVWTLSCYLTARTLALICLRRL